MGNNNIFDGKAMLHFVGNGLFRLDSLLHQEFWNLLHKLIMMRSTDREPKWLPLMSLDLYRLQTVNAGLQVKLLTQETKWNQWVSKNAATNLEQQFERLKTS